MSMLINNELIDRELALNGKAKQYNIAMESLLDIAVLMGNCNKAPDNLENQKSLSRALADFEHIRIDQIRKIFELKSSIYAVEEFHVVQEYTERMKNK